MWLTFNSQANHIECFNMYWHAHTYANELTMMMFEWANTNQTHLPLVLDLVCNMTVLLPHWFHDCWWFCTRFPKKLSKSLSMSAIKYGGSSLVWKVRIRLSILDATECWMQRHMQTSIYTHTQASVLTEFSSYSAAGISSANHTYYSTVCVWGKQLAQVQQVVDECLKVLCFFPFFLLLLLLCNNIRFGSLPKMEW